MLLVDLDVHAGDGSAAIFAGDDTVFTFSIHCADQSFPGDAHPGSDLDVPLPAGAGDAEYLGALAAALPRLLAEVAPDLVLYNAGVDVAAGDQLGRLALTDAGIAARDAAVLRACLGAGVPVAAAIGGGYDPDHGVLVARHMHLHRAAAALAPEFAALMDARRAAAREARAGAAGRAWV